MEPIDRNLMIDSMGRQLTQSLFLELEYNYDTALFTLKDFNYTTKGKTYISLKQLYLQAEDLLEYGFATQHLLGWSHWQRLYANKRLTTYIDDWREELELKIRSQAVRDIISGSAEEKGFQAQKWLADKGWGKRNVGRPSKDTKAKDKRMEDKLNGEFSEDVLRMVGK